MTGPRPIGLTPAEQEKQRTAEYWRKFDATMAERRAQEIGAGIEHGGPIPELAVPAASAAPIAAPVMAPKDAVATVAPVDSALLSAPNAAHQRVSAEADTAQQAIEQQVAALDHAMATRNADIKARRPRAPGQQ